MMSVSFARLLHSTDFSKPFFVCHCQLLICWAVIFACSATVAYLCGVTSFYDVCVILLGRFIVRC